MNRDRWVPACDGTEKPVEIKGFRLWYMWNQLTGEHAYLDMDRDVFLTTEETQEIFNG